MFSWLRPQDNPPHGNSNVAVIIGDALTGARHKLALRLQLLTHEVFVAIYGLLELVLLHIGRGFREINRLSGRPALENWPTSGSGLGLRKVSKVVAKYAIFDRVALSPWLFHL